MPRLTPEAIGREAGDAIATAIADGLEKIILRLAGRIADTQTKCETLEAEVTALTGRVLEAEAAHRRLEGAYLAHLRATAPASPE